MAIHRTDGISRSSSAALALGLPLLATQAVAQCPFEVGQTISPMTSEEIREIVSRVPLEKDTFETTAEFEQRQRSALDQLSQSPFVSYPFFDRKFRDNEATTIRYDADEERVLYDRFFFSNLYDPVRDIFRDRGFIGEYDFNYMALNLDVQDTTLRTYSGGNALGASVEVTEIRRDIISVGQVAPPQDRFGDSVFHPIFKTEVSAEMPSALDSGMEVDDVLTFDLPIEVAKQEFFEIRPVIAVTLQPPYMNLP